MSQSSPAPATSVPSADYRVRVYEPHRRGLPPLRQYLRDMWEHRQFAFYVSRADLKARHFDTWFGQLWTVLNPLLLGMVYFLLVGVIFSSGDSDLGFLVTLLGGLFAFYYTRNALATGASSVVGGGAMVTSTSLPRAILPLSSTITSLLLYLPTLVVLAGFHIAASKPVSLPMVLLPVVVVVQTVFNFGLAMLFGALTVYFRDTASFLPYVLRLWLYVSPVLYRPAGIPDGAPDIVRVIVWANPLTPMLEAWHRILSDGAWPEASLWLAAVAWAFGILVVGFLFFVSREREFAVRI